MIWMRWLLLWMVAQLAGCGGSDPPAMTPLEDYSVSVDRGQVLDYSTEAPAADTSAAGDYVLSELNTRSGVGVTIRSSTDGYARVNDTVVRTNQRVDVRPAAISANDTITVDHLDAKGALVTQKLHTLPQGVPVFHVDGRTSLDGEIALTVGGQQFKSYLLLVDGTGRIIFYRRSANSLHSDFKKVVRSGTTYYTYMDGVALLPVGYVEGPVTVMDRNFNTVQVIDGVKPDASRGRPLVQAENHDFMLLGPNHYIVSGYYGHLVDGIPNAPAGVKLVSSVLQEVKDGVVVFEWNSTDHPELFAQSEEGNNYSMTAWSDYVHFNSFDIDPRDDNLIVSFRGLNAIFKIDRHTGQTLWRYGGRADDFGLTPHQIPQGQHSARVTPDGSLIYFDNNTTCVGVPPALPRFNTPDPANGNLTICDQRPRYSRMVKVTLDEVNRTVTSFHEWSFPNGPEALATSGRAFQVTSYRGSVQLLSNGNLFLGFGSNGRGERDALEWDPIAAKPVFELYFDFAGAPLSQADVASYRAAFSP